MSKKEYMHEWLKADAVRYDLPSEEIIQQLANENEALNQQRDDLEDKIRRLNKEKKDNDEFIKNRIREIIELNQQRDDLLEACKLLLVTLLDAGYDPEISRVKKIAEAAIAKCEA